MPTRFYYGHYFGRPSCPRCGELMLAPEYPEYSECRDAAKSGTFGRVTDAIIASTPWLSSNRQLPEGVVLVWVAGRLSSIVVRVLQLWFFGQSKRF